LLAVSPTAKGKRETYSFDPSSCELHQADEIALFGEIVIEIQRAGLVFLGAT